jgi:hypothetical protein
MFSIKASPRLQILLIDFSASLRPAQTQAVWRRKIEFVFVCGIDASGYETKFFSVGRPVGGLASRRRLPEAAEKVERTG